MHDWPVRLCVFQRAAEREARAERVHGYAAFRKDHLPVAETPLLSSQKGIVL